MTDVVYKLYSWTLRCSVKKHKILREETVTMKFYLIILVAALTGCAANRDEDVEVKTRDLVQELIAFNKEWEKPRKRRNMKTLTDLLKSRKLYHLAHIGFGWAGEHGKNMTPSPVDMRPGYQYFIIKFRDHSIYSSMLFEVEWDEDDEQPRNYTERMFWLTFNFYCPHESGYSYPITRSWYNPWDNGGKLLVTDETTNNKTEKTFFENPVTESQKQFLKEKWSNRKR
jgi:hypothetical protein